MATKEQLSRKVNYLQANEIKYILHRLGEGKESSQSIELLDGDIQSIKEIFTILIYLKTLTNLEGAHLLKF